MKKDNIIIRGLCIEGQKEYKKFKRFFKSLHKVIKRDLWSQECLTISWDSITFINVSFNYNDKIDRFFIESCTKEGGTLKDTLNRQ